MDSELRTKIEKAAQVLVAMGAREVYVFGSAATGRLRWWRMGANGRTWILITRSNWR